jgi:hypothetical protein
MGNADDAEETDGADDNEGRGDLAPTRFGDVGAAFRRPHEPMERGKISCRGLINQTPTVEPSPVDNCRLFLPPLRGFRTGVRLFRPHG